MTFYKNNVEAIGFYLRIVTPNIKSSLIDPMLFPYKPPFTS